MLSSWKSKGNSETETGGKKRTNRNEVEEMGEKWEQGIKRNETRELRKGKGKGKIKN